eukprot:COSAG06_NODE_69858_length_195_cov_39.375000_1_plen_53_part_01
MEPFCNTTRGLVTKIGSGQTQETLRKRGAFRRYDGEVNLDQRSKDQRSDGFVI